MEADQPTKEQLEQWQRTMGNLALGLRGLQAGIEEGSDLFFLARNLADQAQALYQEVYLYRPPAATVAA